MDGFSGIVSFEVREGWRRRAVFWCACAFSRLRRVSGVSSRSSELPAILTHASIPKAERKQAGLDDGPIRLSVGIWSTCGTCLDLKRALASTHLVDSNYKLDPSRSLRRWQSPIAPLLSSPRIVGAEIPEARPSRSRHEAAPAVILVLDISTTLAPAALRPAYKRVRIRQR